MNITKEGIEVKIGQIWEDLDKRTNGRRIEILSIEAGRCTVCPQGFRNTKSMRTKIAIRRMHKSSTGFKLVK